MKAHSMRNGKILYLEQSRCEA